MGLMVSLAAVGGAAWVGRRFSTSASLQAGEAGRNDYVITVEKVRGLLGGGWFAGRSKLHRHERSRSLGHSLK
jgi:hypothetical protein